MLAELRTTNVRAANGSTLVGLAVPYGSLSRPIGGEFREQFIHGSLTKSLRDFPDVFALYAHNGAEVLGRTTANTLELRETGRGLEFTLHLDPSHTLHNNVLRSIGRKDFHQMSFAFSTVRDSWVDNGTDIIRTVHEARLYEVSIVPQPAYESTYVKLRAQVTAALARKLATIAARARQVQLMGAT